MCKSLQQLLGRLNENQDLIAGRRVLALAEIEQIAIARGSAALNRPFGWDDVCAWATVARKSDLARLQAYRVGESLQRKFPDLQIEYRFRASLGDINQNDPLWKMPEKGVFTDDFVADFSGRRG